MYKNNSYRTDKRTLLLVNDNTMVSLNVNTTPSEDPYGEEYQLEHPKLYNWQLPAAITTELINL